jgi:hypothetical protein
MLFDNFFKIIVKLYIFGGIWNQIRCRNMDTKLCNICYFGKVGHILFTKMLHGS